MFELPDAKRVRRTELSSPQTSPRQSRSVSPSTNANIQARLASIYGYGTESSAGITVTRAKSPEVLSQVPENFEDHGLEFRLFAGPTKTAEGEHGEREEQATRAGDSVNITRIRITSQSPVREGEGGLVNPHRPRGYYFTWEEDSPRSQKKQISATLREEFASIAVDGSIVQQWANHKWLGSKLPWRLHLLPASQFKVPTFEHVNPTTSLSQSAENIRQRRKPNKKRRIMIRLRAKKKREREELKAKEEEDKEKEYREKKARRNREKKLKRREKERKEKAERREATNENNEQTLLE